MKASFPRLEYSAKLETPFAVLGIRASGGAIVAIDYLPLDTDTLAPTTPLAVDAVRQLEAFVDDATAIFDLPIATNGTRFEDRVWDEIRKIPAGQVRTYGDVARRTASMPRAVGGACGRNPLPLIIPCHRVIAAGGGLGGFMRGRDDHALSIKRWLLHHEGYL